MTSIKEPMQLQLIAFICLLSINAFSYAGVYKWKDENGKIHFSDKPHKNADEITIRASKPSGIGANNEQLKRQQEMLLQLRNKRLNKLKQKNASKKRTAQINKKCERLRNIILNYKDVDYLFTRDKNGKKTRLSGNVKRKETALLQKEYDDKCS